MGVTFHVRFVTYNCYKLVNLQHKLQLTKLLCSCGPRNSPTLFRMVPPRPCTASSSPRIGVRNPHWRLSGTGKATDFKFGRYIHMVHPNKSPLKIFAKRERGRIQELPNFWRLPPIISETGKATNFKFCTHIHETDWNRSLLNISGKVALGVVTVRDYRKFS